MLSPSSASTLPLCDQQRLCKRLLVRSQPRLHESLGESGRGVEVVEPDDIGVRHRSEQHVQGSRPSVAASSRDL